MFVMSVTYINFRNIVFNPFQREMDYKIMPLPNLKIIINQNWLLHID